jgi:hypothetical protein
MTTVTHAPADIDAYAICTCGARSRTPMPDDMRARWHQAHTATRTAAAGIPGVAAADAIGISYRQLDYWARTNLLVPSMATATGSGSRRRYSPADIELGRLIAALATAGSLEIARRTVTNLTAILADPHRPNGVYIAINDPHQLTTTPPADPAVFLPLPRAA